MKTNLIVGLFEMHILYRNGCQKYYLHRGGGGAVVNKVQKGGIVNKIPIIFGSFNCPKIFAAQSLFVQFVPCKILNIEI